MLKLNRGIVMKKKSTIYYVLVFVSLCILAAFFPLTNSDIAWSLEGLDDLTSVLNVRGTSLFATILTTLFIEYKSLRIITFAILGTSLFAILKNIVDAKNHVLIFISYFLFFLLDRATIATASVQVHGFATYLVGTICTLLFLKLLISNSITKVNYFALFFLGLILSNLDLPFSFTILILTIAHIVSREDQHDFHGFALLAGEILGIIYALSHVSFTYTGFSYNLLHEFIPSICGVNFLVMLVFSSLVMIEAIKIFTSGKTIRATLAIFGISSFLFSSLLCTNDYLNYITFIIYSVSSLYVLLNVTNSRLFKYKISAYYIFKFAYFLLLGVFGNINPGSTLFLYTIDMLIILELYNHILPRDFLTPIWLAVFLVFAGANIYVYRDTSLKYDQMNFFLKNKLECTTEQPITLPSKFATDYLTNHIPIDQTSIQNYIEYYGIDVYDKDRVIEIELRENNE